MEHNLVRYEGIIKVEPDNLTKKHIEQSTQRRVAILEFSETYDITDYYSWFFKRKYGIQLLKSVRPPHVTFLNKPLEFTIGETIEEKDEQFKVFKELFDRTTFSVDIDLNFKCNDKHVWLNVETESRKKLLELTKVVTVEPPKMGWHMTVGRFPEKLISEVDYIKKTLNEYKYVNFK